MATAYVVTKGSYSDYGIVAIFSSKKAAEDYMQFYPKTGFDSLNELDEFELDEPIKYPAGKLAYDVRFTRDGDATVEQVSPEYIDAAVKPYGDGKSMHTTCWADDESHAAKIANERRVQVVAMNQWETDFHAWRASQRR